MAAIWGAHPRSRGEHCACGRCSLSGRGSSPLARGTPSIGAEAVTPKGLIPARAGNTHHAQGGNQQIRAHPRSRGEHARNSLVLSKSGGSSPLARGTLKRSMSSHASAWLIPARAGNTVQVPTLYARSRAHPRSRGEHLSLVLHRIKIPGSSPLARGTLGNATSRYSP